MTTVAGGIKHHGVMTNNWFWLLLLIVLLALAFSLSITGSPPGDPNDPCQNYELDITKLGWTWVDDETHHGDGMTIISRLYQNAQGNRVARVDITKIKGHASNISIEVFPSDRRKGHATAMVLHRLRQYFADPAHRDDVIRFANANRGYPYRCLLQRLGIPDSEGEFFTITQNNF